MRFAVAVSVVCLMLCAAATSEAGAQKKKKKGLLIGSVVSVQADAGKITLKTKANKKKMTPGEEVTVSVGKDTKIERIKGKKGSEQRSTASLADVRPGAKIRVRTSRAAPRQAQAIEIKGKKKKNA
jgi:hypothetical protein